MKDNIRLGRGLESLLPDSLDLDEQKGDSSSREFQWCSPESIRPNPYQPRKTMDNEGLEELAASIREKGILQPLIVRGLDSGGFELIAGERRLRAAKLAGCNQVPVVIRQAEPEDRLELALIENIQRRNLNPMEEGTAYAGLIKEFGLTQEEVAHKVGKQRSTIANMLRLLQLPDYAKKDLETGDLSMGHARVLLSLQDPQAMKDLRDEIIQRELSVRQAEQLAKKLKTPASSTGKATRPNMLPPSYCQTLSRDLEQHLQAKSKIIQNGQRGKMIIEYSSPEDLERLHQLLLGARNGDKG